MTGALDEFGSRVFNLPELVAKNFRINLEPVEWHLQPTWNPSACEINVTKIARHPCANAAKPHQIKGSQLFTEV
jgi:hypothetical protein